MKRPPFLTASIALFSLPALHAADAPAALHAANGRIIPSPISATTVEVPDGPNAVRIPSGMVLIPAGKFVCGEGSTAREITLEAFCIGRFEVTNAEWKQYLDATTGHTRPPRYWQNGTYPEGKANHPVLFVSLVEAQAYCAWISQATGWKVTVPTAEQWEKAARGPQGGRYPWGDDKGAVYAEGKLKSRFNYNAVCAAYYLEHQPDTLTTYSDRSTRRGESVAVKAISDGRRTLGISPDGSVTAWIDHTTNTGFVGTTLYRELVDHGGFTTPVGSYEDGRSPYGCYDMAGNAYEWTSSTITATNGAEKGQQVNDVRGGSWYSTGRSGMSLCTGEGRDARSGYHSVGFRIAAEVPPPSPR